LAPIAAAEGLGSIQDLVVEKRGPSGRVVDLLLQGSSGSLNLRRDQIRRRLRFLPSTLFVLVKEQPGVWRFNGGGFGHGVGLSQAGAIELAQKGWSSGEILSYYFPGTVLEKLKSLPKKVSP
jgi:SpoIID/LytB domain protein